jgi:hypothetical protein
LPTGKSEPVSKARNRIASRANEFGPGLSALCQQPVKRVAEGMSVMMLKTEAERECVRRWRDLPKQDRSTSDQAALFATLLMDDVDFPTSGNRQSFIRSWLQRDLLLRGGH